jgi:GntR family transcriptional regulator
MEVRNMFLLNLQSKDPIYEQIQSQILRFIEAGVLRPGDRLPSVRQLAQENGINPNTAARAYAQLESSGYVYNVPKKGVYVAEIDIGASREQQIISVIRPLIASGITRKELNDVIEKLFTEVR